MELKRQVEDIFAQLEDHIDRLRSVGLFCKEGCFDCCMGKSVEATALEFLPMAVFLFDSGELLSWEKKAQEADPEAPCVILRPGSENPCSCYEKRGLVCRLFGFSFLIGKDGRPQLWACSYLKDRFRLVPKGVRENLFSPVVTHYSLRLIGIDPELGSKYYPINTAIHKALQMVGFLLSLKKAS
ncbi:MAG: YkgJ family cysteine cluster protein [Desulfatiglandales bacterium]